MNFEVREWNTDRAAEVINLLLNGRNVALENSILSGVQKVTIEKGKILNSEPCPEEGYDGGLRDQVTLRFEMEGDSTVTRFFEPIDEVCIVHLESENLLTVDFVPLHVHVKRAKENLDERLKENEEFFSR